jgi:hypothetical protein
MLPIPDKLLKLACDKSDDFRAVQDETTGESTLCQLAQSSEDELVLEIVSACSSVQPIGRG